MADDTRPTPEMLARYAGNAELVAHGCALQGNPSPSGIADLEREYPPAVLARCVPSHDADADDGDALAARGHRAARPGDCLPLATPAAARVAS